MVITGNFIFNSRIRLSVSRTHRSRWRTITIRKNSRRPIAMWPLLRQKSRRLAKSWIWHWIRWWTKWHAKWSKEKATSSPTDWICPWRPIGLQSCGHRCENCARRWTDFWKRHGSCIRCNDYSKTWRKRQQHLLRCIGGTFASRKR